MCYNSIFSLVFFNVQQKCFNIFDYDLLMLVVAACLLQFSDYLMAFAQYVSLVIRCLLIVVIKIIHYKCNISQFISSFIINSACAVKLQQAVLGLSSISVAAHIAFQITLVAEDTLASQLVNC